VAAVGRIVRGTIRFERTDVNVQWALRYAFGVGVPLFLGVATDRLLEGVAISGGALMVGLTDSGGPYRGRVRAMLLTCFTVTLFTFVGEISAHSDVLVILLLAVTSFGAGMYIAMGAATYLVALMVPLSITIVTSLPADALHAAERAGLIFVGGLFAIALVLVLWRRHARLPEREAIAKVYRALAAWVTDEASDRRPVLLALAGARETLDASVGPVAAPNSPGEAFRVLIDEADRTYLDLVALRNARQNIEAWDAGAAGRGFDVGRSAAAEALTAVADALETGHWRADLEAVRTRLDALVAALRTELDGCRAAADVFRADELEEILNRGIAVRGELRGAVDLASSWQGEGAPPEDPVRHARPRPPDLAVRKAGPILRANLTLRSSAFRHAVRLSVTVAIAAAIDRGFDVPKGYWIPLTVLFVLRPDFGATFTRGLQRYIGTALGVVLATLITAALNPGPYALAALITVLAFGFSAFVFANYGLFTLSITACIIFFGAYAGPHNEYVTALARLRDTTIGATLTLVIYALWPTWERGVLPDTMADLIEADRGYVRALFSCWLEPARVSRDAVRGARIHARIARTNTEALVQRTLLEPDRQHVGFGTAGATGILTSLRRFADGALALEAYLDDGAPDTPPETRRFADQLDATMAELARSAREHRPPSGLPPLRATQQALVAEAGPAATLAEETDRMVNSLAITAHVLERGDGTAASEPSTGRGRPASAVAAS
jgi:uncharacterized membrane protein YccC